MDQRLLQASRIAIGFAQGIFLFALQRTLISYVWPATSSYLFASLLTAGFFAPLIVISGLGNLRARTLCLWALSAAAICAVLASYDVYRAVLPWPPRVGAFAHLPSFWVWTGLAAVIFVVESLVVAAGRGR